MYPNTQPIIPFHEIEKKKWYKSVTAFWRNFITARNVYGRSLYVMYSGGVDSSAALIMAKHMIGKGHADFKEVIAVYFNHGTQASEEMEKHCIEFCKKIDVRLIVHKLPIDPIPKGSSEEFIFSTRRYKGVEEVYIKEEPNNLRAFWLSGHHKDDVEESILLGLSRGGDPLFMKGVSPRRHIVIENENVAKYNRDLFIFRPFLGVRKHELRELARSLCEHHSWPNFEFFEDPTNVDERHARNKIRGTVIPSLRKAGFNLPLDAITDNQRLSCAMEEIVMSYLRYADDSTLPSAKSSDDIDREFIDRWRNDELSEAYLYVFPSVKLMNWEPYERETYLVHLNYVKSKLEAYGVIVPANCIRALISSILKSPLGKESSVEIEKGLHLVYTRTGYYLTRK